MNRKIDETATCPNCGKEMHQVLTYVFAEDAVKYRGNVGYYCKHCMTEYTRKMEPLKGRFK